MVRYICRLGILAVVTAAMPMASQDKQAAKHAGNVVIWTNPGDIRSRDLFAGPVDKNERPQPPFRFDGEDSNGNSPKFDVKDGRGEKWKVKVGVEARPEIVATRLLWAVGYFTNENYFVNDLRVEGMPKQLTRGNEYVDKAGEVFQARLQRKPGKDHKPWSWRKNPFTGTREFNGLRVMMALLNNWDLKDENNARYKDKDSGKEIYYVSDVGSTFGTSGKSYSDQGSKSNIEAYSHTKFISKVTPEYVDFNFPTHPALYHIFNAPYFIGQMRNRWVGKKIPVQDVKWIASLLNQLSPAQIEDAFRAAAYSPEQIQAFSAALQARIAELSKL
jgi:hypothetical protein